MVRNGAWLRVTIYPESPTAPVEVAVRCGSIVAVLNPGGMGGRRHCEIHTVGRTYTVCGTAEQVVEFLTGKGRK